jgi:hypothetical protein
MNVETRTPIVEVVSLLRVMLTTLRSWLDRQTLFSWRMPFMAFLTALGLRRLWERR